jgi:hypothetical protein
VKSAAIKVRPGDKIRLSKIDPDHTGGIRKEEACARFVDLREKIDLLHEKLFAEHERSLLVLFQAFVGVSGR